MNELMKRFLIRSTILALVFFIMGWILYTYVIPQHYQNIFPFILIFFLLTTNLVHAYLLRVAEKYTPKFTIRFMATSSLKMLFYLTIAITYAFVFRDQAKFFLINYLAIYMGFTIMEVAEISRIVKVKK